MSINPERLKIAVEVISGILFKKFLTTEYTENTEIKTKITIVANTWE